MLKWPSMVTEGDLLFKNGLQWSRRGGSVMLKWISVATEGNLCFSELYWMNREVR